LRRFITLFSIGAIMAAIAMWSLLDLLHPEEATSLPFVDSVLAQSSGETMELSAAITTSRQNAITRAVERTEKAVVSINVMMVEKFVRRSPFGRQDPLWRMMFPELFNDQIIEREVQNVGSGFIISRDGLILTNAHVIKNAREIIVTMQDGEGLKAEEIGVDELSDVALLKIPGDNHPFIPLGDSDDIIIGEWAIAMGNPFGLFAINNKPTVTVGVVSARDRDFGYFANENKVYQDMIQTDAAINTGNSGGPLLNAAGQVIGMNTFIYTGNNRNQGFVGIGFAIPINRIKEIVSQLERDGEVKRSFYTGIEYRQISAYYAQRLNLGDQPMVVITYVEAKTPAAEAGVKAGDVILVLNGKTINSERDLIAAIYEADLQVGDEMELEIKRDGERLRKRFKLLASKP
jgi:serine protease Do